MLAWVLISVLLALAGIAVIAALSLRLWRQVRQLARDVQAAAARIAAATDELQRVAPDPARRSA